MKHRPISPEQKQANKEFAKRGHLLTALAAILATKGATFNGPQFGPVFSAQVGPFYTRGYIESFSATGLVLLDIVEGSEMPYFVTFGQLSTPSIEQLITLLS